MAQPKSAAAGLMQSQDELKNNTQNLTSLRKMAKEGKEALGKLTRLEGVNERMKERAEDAMEEGVSGLITIGTAAAASYAEGYYGQDKMKVAGADGRVWVGLGTSVVGLGRTLAGKKDGKYLVAAGTGSLVSKVCSSATAAGQEMRSKNAAKQAGGGVPAGDPLTQQVQETPKPSGAAGRERREIRPGPNNVPPHVARLLRNQHSETRAA